MPIKNMTTDGIADSVSPFAVPESTEPLEPASTNEEIVKILKQINERLCAIERQLQPRRPWTELPPLIYDGDI